MKRDIAGLEFLDVLENEGEKAQRKQARQPYSREEIESIFNSRVEANAKHWGTDYIYTRWARESAAKRLAAFDTGEVVEVENNEYHKDCMDWKDTYYSDGTVDTTCYGYTD